MKHLFLIFGIFFCIIINAQNTKFTVALDAGHGGSDPGAVRGNIYESNINLAVALLVGQMLEEHNDIKVLYTRTADKKLEPEDRTGIANKANICVSIHVNSAYSEQLKKDIPDRHGVEVYLRDTGKNNSRQTSVMTSKAVITTVDGSAIDPSTSFGYAQFVRKQDAAQNLSHNLAGYIRDAMGATANRNTRGIENKSLYMTWQLIVPAVLVEIGYITNPAEREFMTSTAGQRVLAKSIYDGIIRYKTDFDKSIETLDYTLGSDTAKTKTQMPTQAKQSENQATIEQKQEATAKPVAAAEQLQISIENSSEIIFAWQIFAGKQKLELNDPQFKNLKNCSCYFQDNLYKYIYGKSIDYNEVAKLSNLVKPLFPQAFIVAVKDGKRIDLDEARRITGR